MRYCSFAARSHPGGRMPKHGARDSRAKNISAIVLKWLLGVLFAGVLVALGGTFATNKLLGTDQAVKEDEAIKAAHDLHDQNLDSPVEVAITSASKPWDAW